MSDKESRDRVKELVSTHLQLFRFTTTEVAKILGEPVRKVRDWTQRKYVVPSIPAQGRGTKALFDRQDLYQFRLLKFLLDRGLDREHGAEMVELMVDRLGMLMKYHQEPQFLCVVRKPGGKPMVGFFDLDEPFQFGEERHQFEDIYLVNIRLLTDEVDRLVHAYRRDEGKQERSRLVVKARKRGDQESDEHKQERRGRFVTRIKRGVYQEVD